jgi:hypothetical protein
MHPNATAALSAAAATFLLAGTVQANLVAVDLDFDTTLPTFHQTNASTDVAVVSSIDPTAGVAGSAARELQIDLTNYAGSAGGAFFTSEEQYGSAAYTLTGSENPDDFLVSFDVYAEGLEPDGTGGVIPLAARADFFGFGNGFQFFGNNTGTAFLITDVLQTITIPATNFNSPESVGDTTLSPGGGFIIRAGGIDTAFGLDADNRVFIDNLQIIAIPEPATATILAGASLLMLRRRK